MQGLKKTIIICQVLVSLHLFAQKQKDYNALLNKTFYFFGAHSDTTIFILEETQKYDFAPLEEYLENGNQTTVQDILDSFKIVFNTKPQSKPLKVKLNTPRKIKFFPNSQRDSLAVIASIAAKFNDNGQKEMELIGLLRPIFMKGNFKSKKTTFALCGIFNHYHDYNLGPNGVGVIQLYLFRKNFWGKWTSVFPARINLSVPKRSKK